MEMNKRSLIQKNYISQQLRQVMLSIQDVLKVEIQNVLIIMFFITYNENKFSIIYHRLESKFGNTVLCNLQFLKKETNSILNKSLINFYMQLLWEL